MFSSKPDFDLKAFLAEPAQVKGSRRRTASTFDKAQKARQEKSKAASEKAEAAPEE
jgi:hypothetical protein